VKKSRFFQKEELFLDIKNQKRSKKEAKKKQKRSKKQKNFCLWVPTQKWVFGDFFILPLCAPST